MVAAKLSRPRPRDRRCRRPAGVWRSWLACYAGVWALTLATAVVVAAAGPLLQGPVRRLLALHLSAASTPQPGIGHVFAVAAHNIPVCCWPLLLGFAGADRGHLGRRVADALVAVSVAVNVLQVGVAAGAYGARLVAFVPQLPLEWAALALGAAGWRVQRRDPLTVRGGLGVLMVAAVLLLGAGFLETFAVPHG